MNVGASSPEDYGDNFAWGETKGYNSGKTNFDMSTYKWCKGSDKTMTKYCNNSRYGYNGFTDNKTELDPEDDAAYVNWGKDWRMPSEEQFKELLNSYYTNIVWTKKNGVKGLRITSKSNGKSIFLPAAAYHHDKELDANVGYVGDYWSRTLESDKSDRAWSLGWDTGNVYLVDSSRSRGQSIRPVRNQ